MTGVIAIRLLYGFAQRSARHRISDVGTLYRSRKILDFAAYMTMIFFLTLVFRDQLGSLTVAIGVAGAGLTFALQEVIVSVAGWFAISLGDFYRVGDRVQLGGSKGDVIDIGILRSTLMEVGEWVNADQYTGRIVRVANSFVFKEPVYNYSRDFPFLWDEITVPVKFGCDHRLARQLLEQIVADTVGKIRPRREVDVAAHVRKVLNRRYAG